MTKENKNKLDTKTGIRAACTWGDGPDVLLILEGKELMLYEIPYHHKPPLADGTYGFIKEGSLCLTTSEARRLASQLNQSAKEAEDLDTRYKEKMKGDS